VLGQHEFDEMLAARDKLNDDLQGILDDRTDAWGSKWRTWRQNTSTSTTA